MTPTPPGLPQNLTKKKGASAPKILSIFSNTRYYRCDNSLTNSPALNHCPMFTDSINNRMTNLSKNLDKYYTKSSVAKLCVEYFKPYMNCFGTDRIIEPSAGAGAFLPHIYDILDPLFEPIALDIAPEHPRVIKHDYLNDPYPSSIPRDRSLTIGNPPFGYKGSLAVDFLNAALDRSRTVGFILPLQFRKWSIQKQITPKAELVQDYDLPEDAFTLDGKNRKVRCSFQIWTDYPNFEDVDLRIHTKPAITHEDFEIFQYNRTPASEKYFDYAWDFAVPRQGWQDYSIRATDASTMDRKKQWVFLKAKNPMVLQRLLALDYWGISEMNTTTPGFGKADIVKAYCELYK